MTDDRQPQPPPPSSTGQSLVDWRLEQLEKGQEKLSGALSVYDKAIGGIDAGLTGVKRELERMSPDRVIRVVEAAEQENKDRRDLSSQFRNTLLTVVFVGILAPVLVLVLSHYVFH